MKEDQTTFKPGTILSAEERFISQRLSGIFTRKLSDGKKLIPTLRLGIADKVFDLNDIIYLRKKAL
jgi:hypothetical protein